MSDILTGPTYWASYLINGDASGLEDDEEARANKWLMDNDNPYVVGIEEDSERFTWSFDLYGGNCAGGDVCDYQVLYSDKESTCS